MTAIASPVAAARHAQARPAGLRRQGWIRRAPLLPALVFTIVVTQIPFLLTLWYSLQKYNLNRPTAPRDFPTFANYRVIFADSRRSGSPR